MRVSVVRQDGQQGLKYLELDIDALTRYTIQGL